ncbi:MAG TPA: LysE family translocator [Tahibacter sp.]|uniref:LysE family translocator n=1 Tax=Tahibacter sp. TaxID=2056211 RepID=UPI002D1180AD|nr:LysE family translocator [Tahibacter sp.]HSX61623.1 LysE family translocator [Tahibacter sp.]
MNAAAGLLFATTLAAAVATPGPSTAAVVSRVLARGFGAAPLLCIGLIAGDLFWLLCAVFGVAALADGHAALFDAVRYAGAAYLLFLAATLWRAEPVAAAEAGRAPSRALLAGLGLALGNPKTMLFYLALLPGIVSLDAVSARDVSTLAALVAVVVGGVLFAYALLAARLRDTFRSPAALRRINRGSAVLMAVAAVVVVTR